MIRPPSLQREFDVILSTDEAIAAPASDASPEAKKEFDEKLKRARDTGNWTALLIEGKQPTKFVCRLVPHDVMARLVDRVRAFDNATLFVGPGEATQLVARIGLTDVVNLPGFELTFERHPAWGRIAKADVLEAIGAEAIAELGNVIFERSQNRPL